MSNIIEVTDSRYGDKLFLNIDNIVAIHSASGTVYTNAVHAEGNGNFKFDSVNIDKIVKALWKANSHD
jgi:hypothetical protein